MLSIALHLYCVCVKLCVCWIDLCATNRQLGSLAGAAHLLNYNAGVLRLAQRGQKSHVDQMGKCLLDCDFQCEYEL